MQVRISPYVSSTRPQRTSRMTFTTGESSCRMPRLLASRAVACATSATSWIQVAASPIACGLWRLPRQDREVLSRIRRNEFVRVRDSS
jgi:hypothetical protein